MRAYQGIAGTKVFFLESDSPQRLLKLAAAVHDAQPAKVVYGDHSPHAALFLAALAEVYRDLPLPEVYVHVYGDFTLGLEGWQHSSGILERFRIQWICASARQARLIGRLLKNSSQTMEVCPFPVDVEHFRPDPQLRKQWREKLGLKDDEWAAVYAGRISLQKNVEPLLRIWSQFQYGTNVKLVIAGSFDDLGAPMTGIREPLNGSFHRFHRELEDTGAIYAGSLAREDMAGLYNAADAYVSLSLHHDEDFGLAPAEALCTGARALLSDWGGYASFLSESAEDCRLIPVKFNEAMGFKIDRVKAFSTLIQSSNVENFEIRVERARRYRRRFSVEAVRESLLMILGRSPQPFAGFSTAAAVIGERMRHEIPFSQAPSQRDLYKFVYANYIG